MRANGAGGTQSGSNPRLEELEQSLSDLGDRIAKFNDHSGKALADDRRPRLTGGSRNKWDRAHKDVDEAERVEAEVQALLDREEETPPSTPDLSGPRERVRRATLDVQNAIDVAAELETACTQLLGRARRVEATAKDPETAALARDFIQRVETDPLSQREDELVQIEHVSFDVELRAARQYIGGLRRALRTILEAVTNIAGFDPGPLAGLDDLAETLARLERARRAAIDPETAEQLERWQEHARRTGAPILAKAEEAEALLRRRERRRGHLRALEVRAVTLGVRDRPEVVELVHAIRDELWIAPTDLDRAEALLLELGNLLNRIAAEGDGG